MVGEETEQSIRARKAAATATAGKTAAAGKAAAAAGNTAESAAAETGAPAVPNHLRQLQAKPIAERVAAEDDAVSEDGGRWVRGWERQWGRGKDSGRAGGGRGWVEDGGVES